MTCPPQHGKGECDGHGAVIKRKARLYLVVGKSSCLHMNSLVYLILFYFFLIKADHHIDNAEELRGFIDAQTTDAVGKVVTMERKELEKATDANSIFKIKSNFEYVWLPNDPKGIYFH